MGNSDLSPIQEFDWLERAATGGTLCYVAEVIGAIFILLGNSSVGLAIAGIGIVILFVFLISGAWLLMIGIFEDRVK